MSEPVMFYPNGGAEDSLRQYSLLNCSVVMSARQFCLDKAPDSSFIVLRLSQYSFRQLIASQDFLHLLKATYVRLIDDREPLYFFGMLLDVVADKPSRMLDSLSELPGASVHSVDFYLPYQTQPLARIEHV